MSQVSPLDRALARLRVDASVKGQAPSRVRFVVACVVSLVASVAVNDEIVRVGVRLYPSIRGYSHLRFYDYAGLTVMGVAAACTAWLAVTQLTREPKRLYRRLGVVVTLVLFIPDLSLLLAQVDARAVLVLVVMHVAVTVVTYNVMVRVAPPGRSGGTPVVSAESEVESAGTPNATVAAPSEANALARSTWAFMAWTVLVEMLSGLAYLLFVPFDHPAGWIAQRSVGASLLHATIGSALAVGSVAVFLFSRRGVRMERIAGATGLCGTLVAAAGGIVCYEHSLRLVGGALMFVGVTVALFGYVMPLIGDSPATPPVRRGAPPTTTRGL